MSLLLLTSLPAFQRWSAGVASHLLEKKVGSRVSIKNLRLNMLGRVVLDGVVLYDRQDSLLLRASRIAAKVDFLPLVEKKIRISGAQLIGPEAKIYRVGEEPFNFQFLVDAFSSKDTTSSPLDLAIGALVVRRGDVRLDLWPSAGSPPSSGHREGTLDTRHLHLSDLSLTARLKLKKPDSLDVDLRSLSFREESGLEVGQLRASFSAAPLKGSGEKDLSFQMELPKTTLSGKIHATSDFKTFSPATGELEGNLCPRDIVCLVPRLANFSDVIRLSAKFDLQDGTLRLPGLSVSAGDGDLSLLCDATIQDFKDNPSLRADIHELRTGPSLQQFLTRNLQGEARELSPILTRLGSTKSSGTIAYRDRNLTTNLLTESDMGSISAHGTLQDMQEIEAKIEARDVLLADLLNLSGKAKGTTATAEATVSGHLPGHGQQPRLSAKGMINSLVYNGYEHRNIPFMATLDGQSIGGELKVDEPNGQAQVNGQWSMANGKRSLVCQALLKDFAPNAMRLIKGYEGERFSGNIDADIADFNPDNLQGELHLSDLEMTSPDKGTLRIASVEMKSNATSDGKHLLVQSDFLSLKADGNINWQTFPASLTHPLRQNLPSLFKPGSTSTQPSGNDFSFLVEVQDTAIAERLLGTSIRLPKRSTLEGTVSDAIGQYTLLMHIPQVQIAGQDLQNIDCRAEAGQTSLQASLQCERLLKGKPVELNLDAYATTDKVTSRLRWDNKAATLYKGDVSISSLFHRDMAGKTAVDARMNKSHLVIGDSVWDIKPAVIKYHAGVVDVENLSVSQAERHIDIGGRISRLASDTLKAELADIDISYVMDLVNFHKVDFDGRATGNIYATSLMEKPFADAFLQVKEFTFNAADLGDMNLYANWGKQERAITLEADISGPVHEHRTHVQGTIIPGKGTDDGLNLYVRTSHINLAFLNKYTKGIFRNLEGRASGWTRIFGPFKTVNLEGDMFINKMKTHVLALGTDYHLEGDSVTLRPDNIWLKGGRVYDYLGMPGMTEHTATVDAHLMHDAFKRMRFDVNVDAHNMLGYNFPTQGSMNFYGTVYTDAQVHLSGEPGEVNIDVAATPMPGTTIVYNAVTPGAVMETNFVTYSPAPTSTDGERSASPTTLPSSSKERMAEGTSDMRINFDINANPNAQISILMDPRSGDNISLYGNGRLRASYYNKGRFQLFGTYRTTEGNYRMSIRDVIRKDFTFQPDGTIVFGGDAMQASLNLRATHTVPNVSLDDLSPTGLGLSNTRVDCIMNIGGIAREPVITFDFDIPNANEDEKQMVRSMLSSEEERDMQAIYLLGVGRFYSYGTMLDTKQTQGSMAMNSVLSSALSSRFNQIMSNALGGTGWSLGTNLRTGEEGWQDLDAEALLSGKMLSGRLQFNGNFGYRDNKYKMGSTGFIGDFDIQYRLSPRSPFSLKAYNQTNDRYFTQSSLTTQGIGIKFQRDFNRFRELFMKNKSSRNNSKKSNKQ